MEAASEAPDSEKRIPRYETHMVKRVEGVVTLDDRAAFMYSREMPDHFPCEDPAPASPVRIKFMIRKTPNYKFKKGTAPHPPTTQNLFDNQLTLPADPLKHKLNPNFRFDSNLADCLV